MQQPDNAKIALLAQDSASTRAVFHALTARFSAVHVILEKPVPRRRFVLARARRLGWATVFGQLIFVFGVLPVLRARAAKRIRELNAAPPVDSGSPYVHQVESVNSNEARRIIAALDPAVVVVNGTRIIDQATLAAVHVPILNMHAGITPAFRGVHGGYWALYEGRPDLVGTTIHLVDRGIDTGTIIAQETFETTDADCFVTYPYLHTRAGIPALMQAVEAALAGRLQLQPSVARLPSRLWSHPTGWQYIRARVSRGVR